MIDSSDDRLLQNILLDAAAEEYIAELASTEDVTTSPRFQRQMKKCLQTPIRGPNSANAHYGNNASPG